MGNNHLSKLFLEELKMEIRATRKCLEHYPDDKFDWKPHERSMSFGYLALLVAEIPLWIAYIIEQSEIDLATFPHRKFNNTDELIALFEENIGAAKRAIKDASDADFETIFALKANGKELYHSSKRENVMQTLNHWVHHRGQMTVYLRLNDIAVPAIYGNSADEKQF